MHILKFKADWCIPCKQLTKAIEEANVDIHISTIDIELNIQAATEYGIRSVPTMIVLGDHNEEITRKTGSMTSQQFKDWVESLK
ncbi:thioredoxin family protein [Flavobacterium sp.]|jgi:thioredoxin 1|uniref:thioredoxin family protein n=1 Tax=Flavobacterium sp. TaxID=239 RepID=UPI0037BF37A7